MQSLIKKEFKRPLSYEMLATLVPKWCRVTRYDALAKFKTLKEALQGKECMVVLYNVHEKTSRKLVNMPGHFVMINTRASGQPTEYFSSSGWGPAQEIAKTHSDPTIFKRLLGKNFIANSIAFEGRGDSNTCWRWTLARAILAHVPLKTFQALFSKKLHLEEKDDVITLMTLLITANKELQ